MRLVITNGVAVRERILPRYRRRHPLRLQSAEFVALVSMGALDWPGANQWGNAGDYPKLLDDLRAAGICAAPLASLLKTEQGGHTFSSWFERDFWSRSADQLARLVELADPALDGLVALDLEPYLAAGAPRRYPKRQNIETGFDLAREEEQLATACAPFVDVLRSADVTPLLLPGGFGFAANMLLATLLPRAILAIESTYLAPFDDRYWQHWHRERDAWAALGRRVLPGFYLGALRRIDWEEQLAKHGVEDHWYFGRPEDQPDDFWEPGWFNAPPRAVATSESVR